MKYAARLLRILLYLFLFIFLAISIRKYFFKSWEPWYQERLYKKPRPLLIQALESFDPTSKEKNVLDLGAGAGNDAAYLLQHGWHVWANDKEQKAIEIIQSRYDIQPYIQNLTLIQKSFIDLPWNEFPKFDLVYAGYALPFAEPSDFMTIWSHILKSIKSGGIFAGHFFGSEHEVFNWWETRKMSFFTKEQLLKLFKEFHIEQFQELKEKNKNGSIEHAFNVIARKLQ